MNLLDINLPNYFLADLPGEEHLTPAIITAACETLKHNREKFLAPRQTGEIVEILCAVAAEWRQPDNRFRQLALKSAWSAGAPRELAEETAGFSRPVLEKGLDGFFRQFTPENFQALLAQDLGDGTAVPGAAVRPPQPVVLGRHLWHGPQLLAHVAAGNLPNPALMSLALGLLTQSAQFMKCASGASLLPRLFAHSIYAADPKLGACLELAEWRGGNHPLESALFAGADCVTATGGEAMLADLRARVPGHVRLIEYGQRASFGLVTREALKNEGAAELVARVADDVVAWDQNGCLSPHVIYVEERGEVESDQFAGRLAAELRQREAAEPRGKISVAEAADIASRRSIYETLAAHRGDVKLWQSRDNTAWTVVFEHDVRFRFSPLNRFVYVKPVPDLAAVLTGVDELKGRVSTVGVAAVGPRLREVAAQLARWGVPRICACGQMQNPPLTWRHDGRPALGDLVTWTDFEAASQMDPNPGE